MTPCHEPTLGAALHAITVVVRCWLPLYLYWAAPAQPGAPRAEHATTKNRCQQQVLVACIRDAQKAAIN